MGLFDKKKDRLSVIGELEPETMKLCSRSGKELLEGWIGPTMNNYGELLRPIMAKVHDAVCYAAIKKSQGVPLLQLMKEQLGFPSMRVALVLMVGVELLRDKQWPTVVNVIASSWAERPSKSVTTAQVVEELILAELSLNYGVTDTVNMVAGIRKWIDQND